MKKSIIAIVVVIALTALLVMTALIGLDIGIVSLPSVQDGIVLGLDLVGGSEITYDAVVPEDATDVDAGMNVAVTMLRQRCDNLGYTEANVYRSGERQVVVEIPNVDNPEEAVQQLGTTAVVEFVDADGKVWLGGSDIASAKCVYGQVDETGTSAYYIQLAFTDEGKEKFVEATKAIASRASDNYMSITMDGETISSPNVDKKFASTGINSDTAMILMGNASVDEVQYLANIISSGALPFALENSKLQTVGATLGEKSLDTSLFAGMIGMILVMVFMIVVYRLPGLVSALTLVFYTALFAVVLAVSHANLTLPGIAGMILTIGMAVDANVIIFERIKEELRAGKSLRTSIDNGYHNAFTAILDSNITTAIAAIVLWWRGSGTIVGFAQTLLIGVVLSMFTMLIITRILLKSLVNLKVTKLWAYGA